MLFDHRLIAVLIAGVLVAVAVLVCLMRYQRSAWEQVSTTPLFSDEAAGSR